MVRKTSSGYGPRAVLVWCLCLFTHSGADAVRWHTMTGCSTRCCANTLVAANFWCVCVCVCVLVRLTAVFRIGARPLCIPLCLPALLALPQGQFLDQQAASAGALQRIGSCLVFVYALCITCLVLIVRELSSNLFKPYLDVTAAGGCCRYSCSSCPPTSASVLRSYGTRG